jgi:hypothetical protein
MRAKFLSVVALCVLGFGTPRSANAATVFEGLGFMPGASYSGAYDVSANGQFAGCRPTQSSLISIWLILFGFGVGL